MVSHSPQKQIGFSREPFETIFSSQTSCGRTLCGRDGSNTSPVGLPLCRGWPLGWPLRTQNWRCTCCTGPAPTGSTLQRQVWPCSNGSCLALSKLTLQQWNRPCTKGPISTRKWAFSARSTAVVQGRQRQCKVNVGCVGSAAPAQTQLRRCKASISDAKSTSAAGRRGQNDRNPLWTGWFTCRPFAERLRTPGERPERAPHLPDAQHLLHAQTHQ